MFNAKDIKIPNKYPGVTMPAYLKAQVSKIFDDITKLVEDKKIEPVLLEPSGLNAVIFEMTSDVWDLAELRQSREFKGMSGYYAERYYEFAADFLMHATVPAEEIEEAEFYPLNTYYTTYSDMNAYQLKWYLYWRKEFLKGNTLDTDFSYICLLSYELINFPFVTHDGEFGINISILEHLCDEYGDLYTKEIEKYQRKWLEDLKCEMGLYKDPSTWEVRDGELAEAIKRGAVLTTTTRDWMGCYDYTETSLTNGQINKMGGFSQKLNNRVAKYASSLADYYLQNKIDLLSKWFIKKEQKEKRKPYVQCTSIFDRPDLTIHYYVLKPSDDMKHDLDEITKISYDLLFLDEKKPEQIVAEKVREGIYDLPKEFLEKEFPVKSAGGTKKNAVKWPEDISEQKEFSLNLDGISDVLGDTIKITANDAKIKPKGEMDIAFFEKFKDGKLDKKVATEFCLENGKLIHSYIAEINDKYSDGTLSAVILEDGNTLVLSREVML